jgi:predicted porin
VGLTGNAGTVRMGTQETMACETFAMDANGRTEYKPQLWRLTQTKGDATSQGDRAGNSVKYISPSYDFGPAVLNYIYAKAFTTASNKAGSLTTHTVGIKVPVDSFRVCKLDLSKRPILACNTSFEGEVSWRT